MKTGNIIWYSLLTAWIFVICIILFTYFGCATTEPPKICIDGYVYYSVGILGHPVQKVTPSGYPVRCDDEEI